MRRLSLAALAFVSLASSAVVFPTDPRDRIFVCVASAVTDVAREFPDVPRDVVSRRITHKCLVWIKDLESIIGHDRAIAFAAESMNVLSANLKEAKGFAADYPL